MQTTGAFFVYCHERWWSRLMTQGVTRCDSVTFCVISSYHNNIKTVLGFCYILNSKDWTIFIISSQDFNKTIDIAIISFPLSFNLWSNDKRLSKLFQSLFVEVAPIWFICTYLNQSSTLHSSTDDIFCSLNLFRYIVNVRMKLLSKWCCPHLDVIMSLEMVRYDVEIRILNLLAKLRNQIWSWYPCTQLFLGLDTE